MATIQLQLRRGTTADINAMTPAAGETLVDTTRNSLVVGDGALAGGYPIARQSDLNAGSEDAVLTPAAIGADTNNYAPAGADKAAMLRLSTSGSFKVTGFASGLVDGRFVKIHNVGANALTLTHEDAGSTAANRFKIPGGNLALAADAAATFQYDATTARWRCVSLQTAVSVMTTRGDLDYRGASVVQRLAIGTANQFLGTDGTDPIWKDPVPTVHLYHATTSALAPNTTVYGNDGSSSLLQRFIVPTGKTLKILGAEFAWDTDATAGTRNLSCFIRANGSTNTDVVTFSTAATSSSGQVAATGTLASPLVSYSAGDLLQIGIENKVTSGANMNTGNKRIHAWGVLV